MKKEFKMAVIVTLIGAVAIIILATIPFILGKEEKVNENAAGINISEEEIRTMYHALYKLLSQTQS